MHDVFTMQALIVTEFVMAALMLPWAAAYFLFPAPVADLIGQSDEARRSALGVNLLGVARFVRQCAISHVVMGIMALAMGFAMLGIGDPMAWIAVRVLLPVQLLFGGVYSFIKVRKFRHDAGRRGKWLTDLMTGIRGL